MNVNITTMSNNKNYNTINTINYSNLDCYCEAILSNNKNRCSQKKKLVFSAPDIIIYIQKKTF